MMLHRLSRTAKVFFIIFIIFSAVPPHTIALARVHFSPSHPSLKVMQTGTEAELMVLSCVCGLCK